MSRLLVVLTLLAATGVAVVTYKGPKRVARASDAVSQFIRQRAAFSSSSVQIRRASSGEFALRARINGVAAPMVVDTGATSVVLTYETAKAAGLCHTRGGTGTAPRSRSDYPKPGSGRSRGW